MELAHRNAALAYRTRFDANATANYEALESLQAALRLPKLPRRIDCFDISTIQGSETVASMVVCEEGRMRPSEYRKFKIKQGRPGPGLRPDPGYRRVPGRFCRDGAGCPPTILQGPRERRAVSRSDRDRRRQGAVERGVCGARDRRACRIWWRSASRRKRSSSSRATASSRSRSIRTATRYGCCSAFETKRIVCDHLPPSVAQEARSAVGARRGARDRPAAAEDLLTAFGSLSGVRRATREELARVVGVKVAEAVIAHFAANP